MELLALAITKAALGLPGVPRLFKLQGLEELVLVCVPTAMLQLVMLPARRHRHAWNKNRQGRCFIRHFIIYPAFRWQASFSLLKNFGQYIMARPSGGLRSS